MKILILLSALFLVSCATNQPPFEPESFKKGLYRKDMKIVANGHKGHGVLVVPQNKKYKLEMKALGKLDLFTFQSCHREITQEDAGYKGKWLGFGRDKKLAKMEYEPVTGLEDDGSCPVDIGGYEKKKGRHSWGSLIPENKHFKLPAIIKCNGREVQSRGTSVCQSHAGLIQRVEFQMDVGYDLDAKCEYKDVKLINNRVFQYRVPEGNCLMYFRAKELIDGKKVYAEHYDYGYTKIIIMGD